MDPLNPVDLVVLVGTLAGDHSVPWTQLTLSRTLGLPPSTVSRALVRLADAQLWERGTHTPNRRGAEEFLVHGARYAFPSGLGAPSRGVPTAHAAPPLRELFVSDEDYVWADEDGEATGLTVEPLHPACPGLRTRFPAAYELLTLVDALRVGRARERRTAAELLRQRLADT